MQIVITLLSLVTYSNLQDALVSFVPYIICALVIMCTDVYIYLPARSKDDA